MYVNYKSCGTKNILEKIIGMPSFLAILFIFLFGCDSEYKKTERFSKPLLPVDVSKDMVCTYQKTTAMFYYEEKIETSVGANNKPLEWTFISLNSKMPEYLSGGDRGNLIKMIHTHDDGITLLIPQGAGAHIFTIWPDGISYWSKHNNIMLNAKSSQTLLGRCSNIVHR